MNPNEPARPIRTFRDLLVWQKAIQLAITVYRVTQAFPKEEKYGLTSQVRRAAVSVSSNIAEGHARQGREFAHFLSIARGSAAEVESQLYLAAELGFIEHAATIAAVSLAGEIHRMAASLAEKVSGH
ncbi:MAG TPA: four helix bundle protein [Urbifossiella sp.]|nr:four helix bundle protein [Urbifossiella sp.]